MLSLFSPDKFIQGYDRKNSLYLLLNKEMLKKTGLTKEKIEEKISILFEGNFSISI